jgi:hypothetical protein
MTGIRNGERGFYVQAERSLERVVVSRGLKDQH